MAMPSLFCSTNQPASDLADMTEAEVSEIRNLGKKSLQEIGTKLREQGLEFRNVE